MDGLTVAELRAPSRPPRFDPPDILWYFGAIVAAAAAVTVAGDTGSAHRGVWVLLVGLAFLVAFAALSATLLRLGHRVPGGVLAAAAVVQVPAAGTGFERLIGVWPHTEPSLSIDPFQDFQGAVFALVVATVVASVLAFWLIRFPFVLLPGAIATPLAVQLFLPVLVDHPSVDDHALTLIVTGAILILVGLLLDARLERGAAFWWHVIGWLSVAVGLTYYLVVHRDSWAWITILLIGAVILIAAAPLRRATWAVFGVAGVYVAVLHYVESNVGSWKAPLVLTVVGVGLVLLGIVLDASGGRFARRLSRPRFAP